MSARTLRPMEGEGLVALGIWRVQDLNTPFSKADLLAWSSAIAQADAGFAVLEGLRSLGFIQRWPVGAPRRRGASYFVLTAEGAAAAQAELRSRRQARLDIKQRSHFAVRLWALLRARTMLTALDAACVLCDAGEENIDAARRLASRHLSAWALLCPQAIQVGARRVEGGKRYVLVKDPGPELPGTRQKTVRP